MKFKIPALILCFLFALAASPSFSQPSGMGMKKWRGENPCWKASELNLSSEQRKGLDLIQETYFREIQSIRAQLFTKRLELREFLLNPTMRIESIRVKYSEIIELQSREEEKAIEYLIKVRSLLTQEQLKMWCPELEFTPFRPMRHGPGPKGPMFPRKPPSPEGSREE